MLNQRHQLRSGYSLLWHGHKRFTARAIGSASPESTNTPAGIHTDALGLPRHYAMAPVLQIYLTT